MCATQIAEEIKAFFSFILIFLRKLNRKLTGSRLKLKKKHSTEEKKPHPEIFSFTFCTHFEFGGFLLSSGIGSGSESYQGRAENSQFPLKSPIAKLTHTILIIYSQGYLVALHSLCKLCTSMRSLTSSRQIQINQSQIKYNSQH